MATGTSIIGNYADQPSVSLAQKLGELSKDNLKSISNLALMELENFGRFITLLNSRYLR